VHWRRCTAQHCSDHVQIEEVQFPDFSLERLQAKLAQPSKQTSVRYADDFVLLCRKVTPRLESFVTEKIEQWLGLKINRDKTRIYEVKASESGLDFLGFNFQLAPSPHGPLAG
jgi:hypothetical protein